MYTYIPDLLLLFKQLFLSGHITTTNHLATFDLCSRILYPVFSYRTGVSNLYHV